MRRAGFTIIELLIVVTIIGIIATVALPKFRQTRRHAMATQLIGDFDVVRHAAMSFYADSGYFPDADDEPVPRNLLPYLPNGFSMVKAEWEMQYVVWPVPPGVQFANNGATVGVTFTTSDPALGMTAMRLSQSRPGFMLGTDYTFLVAF